MRSPRPAVINIQIEDTPSSSDPQNADEFYRALGIAVMALGRLEGHFNACLLTLMRLACGSLGYELRISWNQRAETWRKAFHTLPVVNFMKDIGEALVTEIVNAMQDCHILAHGMWERFATSPSPAVYIVTMKHQRGTKDGIVTQRGAVTIEMLTNIASTANTLNRRLIPISQYLQRARGPAPPNARRHERPPLPRGSPGRAAARRKTTR